MQNLNPIVEDYMANASKKLFEASQIKDTAFAWAILTSIKKTIDTQIQILEKKEG